MIQAENLTDLITKKYKSLSYEKVNVSVEKQLTVLDEKYSGALAQVLFICLTGAPNQAYSVRIIADGVAIYNGTWSTFDTYDSYMSDVICADDATYGYLSFSNIFFDKNIIVEIHSATNVSFSYIWVKALKRIEE